MTVFIYPNLSKTKCKEYTVQACGILEDAGIRVCFDNAYQSEFSDLINAEYHDEDTCVELSSMIIAVGGDGTILRCAQKAAVMGKPVLGINCGRLGFMASLEHSQLELLRSIATGEHSVSRRMLIQVRAETKDGQSHCATALNDVVISRSDDCKIADFDVSKNGQLVSQIRANGVIFSTATGATAYSMSAGGPIIEPEMECIEFTQICPHSLFARSMVFAASSIIKVKCHSQYDSHLRVMADGNNVCTLTDGEEVIIEKSPLYLDIIDIKGGSFFSSVNEKLMQPLKKDPE